MSDPTLTIADEFGTVRVDWPNPPARSYEVSHEVIQQYADTVNRVAAVRRYCSTFGVITPSAILWLLNGGEL